MSSTPTTPNIPATVKLSGRDGILSAVPALLGFHPADSVVVVCLSGPRRKVGPVVRVDLADCLAAPAALALPIMGMIGKFSDEVALVFYGIDHDPMRLADKLAAVDIPLLDTIFVGNENYEIAPNLHAEIVGTGTVVEAARDDVRSQVEYDPTGNASADEETLNAMYDITARDEFLAGATNDPEMLQRVLATCRSISDTPAEQGIPTAALGNLCAVAAVLTYRRGNGALAQICVDRALRADADQRLAHLMLSVMACGMPPADLDSLTYLS